MKMVTLVTDSQELTPHVCCFRCCL